MGGSAHCWLIQLMLTALMRTVASIGLLALALASIASPAIANGRLYIRGEHHLFAIGNAR